MTSLICCWTRKHRRSKTKTEKKQIKNDKRIPMEFSNQVFGSQQLNTEIAKEADDGYTTIPNPLQQDLEQPEKVEKTNQVEGKEQRDPAVDHSYLVLEAATEPEASAYYLLGAEEEDEGEYDYAQPFFEPADQEEELVCQISDLKVPQIPSSCVELLDPLGSGQFGEVYKGIWIQKKDGKEVSTEVAIKTMKEGATEEDKVKFLQEAAIMGQFRHPNILGIQGIIMDNDDTTLKLVIDLMNQGDLRQHLLALKQSVLNKDMPLCMLGQLLVSFTRQTVWGLSYLNFKCYIHRDLAARNILVSEDGTCKIADFGLSRDLHHENYYKSSGGKVPVKWTAPEALLYRKYSHASDVWSYGCLLYEIWSLGEKPFSQYSNTETIKLVANGYRLPPPPGCPRAIYSIMIDCWNPDTESRPMSCDIVTKLQQPDFTLLKWAESEKSQYSEESRTLGSDLDSGDCLHMNLQQKYKSNSVQ